MTDPRRVWLRLLAAGESAFTEAPDPLHETFARRFEGLPDWEQAMLVAALERVATLMDANTLDAAPYLDIGDLG